MAKKTKKPLGNGQKQITVEYNEESGCWHVMLTFDNGDKLEVAHFYEEADAKQSADDINRWSGN